MDRPKDRTLRDIGHMLEADYRDAKQPLDAAICTQWVGHILWDMIHNGVTESAAIMARRKEWRKALGLPPLIDRS